MERIFARPTPPNIRWAEVESLMRALDVEVLEGAGSRVRLSKDSIRRVIHRPHPSPYLARAAVRNIAVFLTDIGVEP